MYYILYCIYYIVQYKSCLIYIYIYIWDKILQLNSENTFDIKLMQNYGNDAWPRDGNAFILIFEVNIFHAIIRSSTRV